MQNASRVRTISRSAIFQILFFFPVLSSAAQTKNPPTTPVPNRQPLAQTKFYALPLGAIVPSGWLREQLELQAHGLTGHLDEIWPDLQSNSGWLGGTGEAWERGPYFMDGLIPLAYLLKDPRLSEKARKWVDWTLTHQQPSGQIGPLTNDDWWPRMVMLKVLTQYQEATGDPRVIPLMQKYFVFRAREIDIRPLKEWGRYRWQDELVSIIWLYNRTGDPALLDLARRIHAQGFDWQAQFTNFPFTTKQTKETLGMTPQNGNPERAMQSHGVNNAMALKASPVWFEFSNTSQDRQAIHQQLAVLDQYHSLPNGMFSADEHFAGRDPSQGVELCAVVEAMYSLEISEAILGDPAFADRLEKISFNALPATISDDMWSHQYDQQPNQVKCTRAPRDWSTNGPDSNLFGLEPNFGCCTANMHQGWPKLAESLWMATPDHGLVAMVYAPNEVHTVVGASVNLSITEETGYPFDGRVLLTMRPDKSVQFPVSVRIPAWAEGTSIRINGQLIKETVHPSAYLNLTRKWIPGDKIEIQFPMRPRISRWYRDSAVIERGPLLYSLDIPAEWTKLVDRGPASDWEVRPTADWNFALALNPQAPDNSVRTLEATTNGFPFSAHGHHATLEVRGKRLPSWQLEQESAGPLPPSPVTSSEPEQTLRLIPYGAAKLRITEFPVLAVP